MKKISALVIFLLSIFGVFAQNNLNRFAGLHFDFHATLQDSSIGKTMTAGMIDSLLTITKPDFLQVDCKGHPGIASYPTEIGTGAPNLQKDILKIFREETAKYHVPLYIHYSGILDHQAVALHPDWARINADGKIDSSATSVFGAYCDSLMIPQLKEVASKYKVDGAWIDGDCWALTPDYSPVVISAFKQQTGFTSAPVKTDDPHYFEWAEFNRKGFLDYMAHYINALHQAYPDLHITSNWAFSSFIPEKVSVLVDFLSGDVAGVNSLYSSAFESRCMALQGKPWDLMSWSFTAKGDIKVTRSVPQLEQQAAEVLTMGGGYQTYWNQNRDGTPETYQFQKMKKIIKFCKDRKKYCFGGKVVPQIGLLYSAYTLRHKPFENLYNGSGLSSLKTIVNILLDSQLPVEILMDHQLTGRLNQYPLMIIPEWSSLDPEVQKQLTDYVNQGGNLLVIGADAVKPFEPLLKTTFSGMPKDTGFYTGYNDEIIFIQTRLQPVQANKAITLGSTLTDNDFRFPSGLPLASVTNVGKGKIAALYINIADFYEHNQNPFIRKIVKDLSLQLLPAVKVKIQGDEHVHTVITRKNDKQYVHLINTNGPHNNPEVMTYDEVTPIHQLTVSVRLPKKPASIVLQPAHKPLPVQYKDGFATVTIDALGIYDILEIKE